MAETSSRNDPFLAFRYEVKFTGGLNVAGFSECNGLEIETEVHSYSEGGENSFVHKFPTRTKHTNIVLKRGIVDREMYDWYLRLVNGEIERRDGSIIVKDPSGGETLAEWQFRRAFACKWRGPDLNATQNAVAVETIELAHEGLLRKS